MIFLLAAALGVQPERALACSCAFHPNSEESVQFALERKDVIFAGTVQRIESLRSKLVISSADQIHIVLEVSEVWKGTLGPEASVYTALHSESCGYENFQKGEAYLVSANVSGTHKLVTSLCDLTMPLSSAAGPLSVLGNGYAPDEDSAMKASLPSQPAHTAFGLSAQKPTLFRAALTLAAALIAVLVIVRLRKRGKR